MSDLRQWLASMREVNQIRDIEGTDWDLELSAVHFVNRTLDQAPALLFDRIKGYPPGYRVLTGSMDSKNRVARLLGMTPDGAAGVSDRNLLEYVRKKLPQWKDAWRSFPPVEVKNGPILEEVHDGKDVNLWEFPAPKWFPLDGGRYLGTGDAVITADPDSGAHNIGTYRIQVHDENTLGLFISQGKHGRLNYQKYFAKGEPCPVVVSFGHHPVLFAAARTSLPAGAEYGWAGAVMGEPVQVIKEELTGLPMPADSEIVAAGWVFPHESRVEGPFGEWTGYYASGARPAPVIKVERIYHRHDPIIMGCGRAGHPPGEYYGVVMQSAMLFNELEERGVPDVRGVWVSNAAKQLFIVISIKQRYGGHAKQAALVASQSPGIAYFGRYIVVVDEDIDPASIDDVIWAIGFRSDPEKDIDIIRGARSTLLDPLVRQPVTGPLGSRAIIDACKPFDRLDSFPPVIEMDKGIIGAVKKKYFVEQEWDVGKYQ
jgi:UbiD family decarboxylase